MVGGGEPDQATESVSARCSQCIRRHSPRPLPTATMSSRQVGKGSDAVFGFERDAD